MAELEWAIDRGAKLVNLAPGPAFGRSPFDPYFDPYWARVNEAELRVAVHLGGGGYQRHGADWGEDPDAKYSEYNAFQWVSYWSDRPVMETITAMMFHNLFGRFPNIKVLIAEFGTPWLPYLVRKLDHAALLGRKPKWGTLPGRPVEHLQAQLRGGPVPRGERPAGHRRGRGRLPGLRLGLPPLRGPARPDPVRQPAPGPRRRDRQARSCGTTWPGSSGSTTEPSRPEAHRAPARWPGGADVSGSSVPGAMRWRGRAQRVSASDGEFPSTALRRGE